MGEHLVKIRCIKCEVDNWVDDNDPIECPTCNTKNTLPLEIGRYMVHSSDNSNKLNKILKESEI